MQYKILNYSQVYDLEEEVSKKISEGWEPIGGVSVTISTTFTRTFCQAMIKK